MKLAIEGLLTPDQTAELNREVLALGGDLGALLRKVQLWLDGEDLRDVDVVHDSVIDTVINVGKAVTK